MRIKRQVIPISVLIATSFSLIGCSAFGVDTGAVIQDIEPSNGVLPGDSSAQKNAFPPDSISWDEAMDHVGTIQTVCGPVASTGNSDNDYFVNLGYAYPDTRRFQFVFWDVGELPTIRSGDNVCATGEVVPYEDVFELELYSTDALVFLN